MATKSCVGCPSALSRSEVAQVGRRDVGACMCARHGHVLGVASGTDAPHPKIGEAFAENCPDWNKPRPVTPPTILPAVVASPLERAVRAGVAEHETNPATSCASCKFLIDEGTVHSDKGWNVPMCAATGRLIFPRRFAAEAKSCGFGVTGTQMPKMIDDVEFFAMYGDDYGYGIEDFNIVDATRILTDKEVEPADAAYGIRAWRKVEDPDEYGEPVYLPAFDPNHFDEDQRAKIPVTGGPEKPESYVDHSGLAYALAVEWMELDETPCLVSEPGLGKTEGVRHVAWQMGLPFTRITINKDSDADALVGTWLFTEGETRHKLGNIPMAWERAGVLLLDEPNRGGDQIQELLLPMTDNSKQFVLEGAAIPVKLEDGSTVMRTPPPIVRDPWAFLALAINPAWDPRNSGTMELTGALQDRVTFIELGLPPREVEEQILMRAYAADFGKPPAKRVLEQVMAIADELRSLSESGALPITWGIRPNVQVVRKSKFFRLPNAYKRAIADYFEPQTRQMILDVVNAHVA